MNQKGALSILQICILVLGVFAISYLIGSEVRIIKAADNTGYEADLLPGDRETGYGPDLLIDDPYVGAPPITEIPSPAGREGVAKGPTHGYAGKAWEALFGEGTTAPGTFGYSGSGVIQGAYHAVLVYGIVSLIGGFLGLKTNQVNAAATAAAWGTFAYDASLALFGDGGYLMEAWMELFDTALSGLGATGIGLAVAVIVYIMVYSDTSTQVVDFTCNAWDANTGGENCEKCNQQGDLPCSEYQCRSLGQACQLLNPGTQDEKCTWVNPKDVNPPVITTNPNSLLDGYKFTPDNAISPPDKGVKIINQNSKEACANAFTPFTFGITTDEPAKCKIDYLRKDSFDEMQFYFGGNSLLTYNHTQAMSLPGVESLSSENITLENGGQFELYARCQDANGNSNVANFVFKYCVEEGPDTTPPLIVTTSLLNGMPVAYNQSSVELEIYVNEPSECKWSHLDEGYDDMEKTFSCASSVKEINAQSLYTCKTILDGIKNNEDNNFYFRCKDQPLKTSDRNVNSQSYKFTLKGTIPLVIDSAEPDNETIKDSTDAVKVTLKAETSAGYNEGEASCFYSEGDENNYVMFYETQSYEHSQDLWLPAGEYNYFINCIDLGGNSDTKEINFIVESDNEAPLIVRAYHDEPYLKIITNEEAECVFDTTDCSYLFNDGTSFTTSEGFEHYTDWNTKTNLYIKCQDKYGNSPQPSNVCSIEVRAF